MSDKTDGLTPRRFRIKSTRPWCGRPAGTTLYGVYFPATDCCVMATGGLGTGIPADVEWIDPINVIPWHPSHAPERAPMHGELEGTNCATPLEALKTVAHLNGIALPEGDIDLVRTALMWSEWDVYTRQVWVVGAFVGLMARM